MTTTAVQNLTAAHREILALATKISAYLAEHEGFGSVLTFADIASGVGIDLRSLKGTDSYVFYMASEAATDFRMWSKVSDPGEISRFQKRPVVVSRRKPRQQAKAKA